MLKMQVMVQEADIRRILARELSNELNGVINPADLKFKAEPHGEIMVFTSPDFELSLGVQILVEGSVPTSKSS